MDRELYLNSNGASFWNVHVLPIIEDNQNQPDIVLPDSMGYPRHIGKDPSDEKVDKFGCTCVAFGQVLYGLHKLPGVKDLTYTSGEKVLWNLMDPLNSIDSREVQRFLGWITTNCNPTYFEEGTFILNKTAKKFVEKILGNHLSLEYKSCTPLSFDFNGFGWKEGIKIIEEMRNNKSCMVVMTASKGTFQYLTYHSYVIDGLMGFWKEIEINNEKVLFEHYFMHINLGWGRGVPRGYYYTLQTGGDEYEHVGNNSDTDFRSNVSYTIIKAK